MAASRVPGCPFPFSRAPELVLRDVRDEVVSVDAAARDYGVVIGADGRSIDVEATATLRAGPREALCRELGDT